MSPSALLGPYFAPAITRKHGAVAASHVAVADVTGDGKKDVLTSAGPLLAVFVQQANGSIATSAVTYPASGMGLTAAEGHISVGDLTGDGLSDVVLSTGNGVDIYEQAAGILGPFTHVTTQVAGRSTAIGDIDGDEDNEIFLGDALGISYLSRTPAGWVETPVSLDPASEIEVADVNDDDLIDVISLFGQQVKVYPHWADINAFKPGDPYTVLDAGLNPLTGLEILDVDGDGLEDVLVAGPDELRLFHQTAAGTLGAPVGNRNGGYSLDTADVNGDAVPDVAVGGSPWIFEGISGGGLGSAWTPMEMNPVNTPDALVLGDVSGDGLTDVITAGGASGISIRTQYVPANTGTPSWITDQGPADFASGVPVTVHPSIEFVRELDPTTVDGSTVALVHGATLAVQPATLGYDPETRTITITPASPLVANTPYIVVLWRVRDTGGTYMETAHTYRFKTA